MFKYIFSISFYFTIITLVCSQNLENAFYNYLLDWKINYEELKEHKAGAVCIPVEKNKIAAIGISYKLFELSYAKKIAIDGCNRMKKKKKILSDCKCEIILENNLYVGD